VVLSLRHIAFARNSLPIRQAILALRGLRAYCCDGRGGRIGAG